MKPRILLADDDVVVSRIVRAAVESRGFACETTSDGEECLALLRDGPHPDLLLLDLLMPRLGGIEVLEELARSPVKERFAIAVLSGRKEVDSVRKAIQLGADDFIVKPFLVAELVGRVDDLLFLADEPRMRSLLAGLVVPDPTMSTLATLAGFETRDTQIYRLNDGQKRLGVAIRGNTTPSRLARAPWPEIVSCAIVFRLGAAGWRKVWPRFALGQGAGESAAS